MAKSTRLDTIEVACRTEAVEKEAFEAERRVSEVEAKTLKAKKIHAKAIAKVECLKEALMRTKESIALKKKRKWVAEKKVTEIEKKAE